MKLYKSPSLIVLALAVLLAAGCSASPTTPPPAVATAAITTALDGQALLNERCTKCHSLDRVEAASKTADEWKTTVARMVGKGAKLSAEEQAVLLDYLAKTHSK